MSQYLETVQVPSSGTPAQVYTLTYTPAAGTVTQVILNGLAMTPSIDYTISAAIVTFTGTAITNNDIIVFIYWIGNQPAPSGSLSAQDIIYRALRRCGQMRPGYINAPELLNDCFLELLDMYDGWNAERTMQYTDPDYVFPVTGPGHGTTGNNQSFGGTGYDIGPTATDFVCPRPVEIVRMNLYMTSVAPTQPTRIPLSRISMEEWMSIAVIQLPAINVTTVYTYDPQYPNGVIWIWPPLNGNSLEIFTWGQLVPPASLGATVGVPPGYMDALTWTLAQRCWPYCTKDIMPHRLSLQYIAGQGARARDRIKYVNAETPRVINDFRGGGGSGSGACDWDLLLTGRPY